MARARVRLTAIGALVLALAAVGALALGSRSEPRTVRAAFASAGGLFGGLELRMQGRRVGEVESVDYVDGQAVAELRVDDGRVWPLRRGTVAQVRYGATVSVAARYVELRPGPPSAPAIRRGGLLTRSDTVTAVEVDDVLNMLDRDARGDVKGLLAGARAGLDGRERQLGEAVEAAPGGLDAAASLMRELGADPRALSGLVAAGDRTARALASRDGELRDLLDGAATTFDVLAADAAPIRASLERLPRTLRTARGTLARTDRSLAVLDPLVGELRPGAQRLVAIAPSASTALATLADVAPLASSTLRRGTIAMPEIGAFLRRATPLLPRLRGALRQTADATSCIRPYAPEIAGFVSTWAGFAKNHDADDHYGRVLINVPPFPAATPLLRARDVVGLLPGLRMAFPRPPGLSAGQTWLQPACGAGAQALDPRHDPDEAP